MSFLKKTSLRKFLSVLLNIFNLHNFICFPLFILLSSCLSANSLYKASDSFNSDNIIFYKNKKENIFYSFWNNQTELKYGDNVIKFEYITHDQDKELSPPQRNKKPSQFKERNQYIKIGWHRSLDAPLGQKFDFNASTQNYFYQADVLPSEKKTMVNSTHQLSIDWSRPLSTGGSAYNMSFQPLGKLTLVPRQKGSGTIPLYSIDGTRGALPNDTPNLSGINNSNLTRNDDGLFSENEADNSGSRFFYGGQIHMMGDYFRRMELFLGQKYSFASHRRKRETKTDIPRRDLLVTFYN